MEAADQVFTAGEIDSGFTTHRRIDLRQKRRGHLDDGNAAHKDGGEKPAYIRDNSATKTDH